MTVAEPRTEAAASIVFAAFRLDLRGGQLTRAGTPIPLRPKTWAVLRFLAERPGELVSKDALLDAVWPDVAVTPDTLTKSIGELRVALGEDARTPRFIETVHRRGFRFIGQTTSAPAFDVASQTWRGGGDREPIVGRATELRQLADAFAKACAGERQMVFITGAAGVGKTTLVEAFLESHSVQQGPRPVWVGRGACVEQHGPREAYMPVLEGLDRLARRPDAAGLVDLLRRIAPTWLAQLPWLIGDDADHLRHVLQAARTERMLREFAALTEALTAEVPLILVLEDLHWSDPSTIDLLSTLAQRHERAPMLIIATYRPAEVAVQQHVVAHAVRALLQRRQCVRIPIHELSPDEVRDYLLGRFPGAALPPTLAGVLHAHTDGNPLFVRAIVEHMLARGWILDTAPGWWFSRQPEDLELGVPDDARRMIATQLEGLSPADRKLLEAASAVGTEFATPAVAAALCVGLEEVETRCEELARMHRFLRSAGSCDWPDGSVALRYAFPHELYRQAVYEALPSGRRQRLHQRIGEALEAAHGERANEIAGELAAHFEHGGDVRRGLLYLDAAATRAVQRGAGREAIGFLDAALALTARLPDAEAQQRQELALRLRLAPLLSDHFGFASAEVHRCCERADALARSVGTPRQRFEILFALCHVYAMSADGQHLAPTLDALAQLADELGGAEDRWLADSTAMRTAALAGRFAETCRLADERVTARLTHPAPLQVPAYGPDPRLDSQALHAYALWFLGHTATAVQQMRAALAAAEVPGTPIYAQVNALALMALLETLRRNPVAVRRLCDGLRARTGEHGFQYLDTMGEAFDGWARIQAGELDAAVAALQRARDSLVASGVRTFATHIQAFLAEAHLRAGNAPAGLTAVEDGLRIAATTLDRSYWPELWRLKGQLLLAGAAADGAGESATPAAEQCLRQAIDLARAAESRSLELRAATSLAGLWSSRGRAAEARALLAPLCQWFGAVADADADSPDLREARAVLAHLSGGGRATRRPRTAPPTPPATKPLA